MKQLFTKPRLILLGKMGVFVAGQVAILLIIATERIAGYFWGPGVIFGFVVLVWHATSLRSITTWRSVAFMASTTGIYAVVSAIWYYALVRAMGVIFASYFVHLNDATVIISIILILGGVLLGTILLPTAHALLLGATLKRVLIAIPCIIAGFLVACLPLVLLDDGTDYIGLPIIVWQAAYLVSMFGFRKKEAAHEGEGLGALEYAEEGISLEEGYQ